MNIHRAIRPAETPDSYFIYLIEYTGKGFDMVVTNMTIHRSEYGKVGPNILPPDMVGSATVMLAAINIITVDGLPDYKHEPEL